jgi:DHA2 family multidrug resistance protein
MAGLILLGLSLQNMTHFSLDLDYRTAAHARMFQGVGIGLLFVPVSQIAYSYLPKDKNNQASSITNLFRNQGGSFGIAFVTTMLARRSQYHQSVLASHITPFNTVANQTLSTLQTQLVNAGMSATAATARAQGQLYAMVQKQAAMLSFIDCFWLLSIFCFSGIVLCFAVKPSASDKAPAGAH